MGINACKGQSKCKTAENACAGQNSCKGHGWLFWNAPQVWRALDGDEEPPAPTRFDNYWFVYRGVDLMSQWHSADACEAEAIQLWSRGEGFEAICAFLYKKCSQKKLATKNQRLRRPHRLCAPGSNRVCSFIA